MARIVTVQTPSRFSSNITGPARAAQVVPVHSQHTQSMIAQASRVPRLAKLNTNMNSKNIAAAAARGKSGRR